MNMKTLIAAFAVAATTVASAGTFKWTLAADYWKGTVSGADKTNGAAFDHFSKAPSATRYQFVDTVPEKVNWGYEDGKFYANTAYDSDQFYSDYYGKGYKLFIKMGGWNTADAEGNALTSTLGYMGYLVDVDTIFDELAKGGEAGGSYAFKDKNGHLIGTFTGVVPEPTSGLMLLLGAGMLALRRKAVRA